MKKIAFTTLSLFAALHVFSFRVQTEVNKYVIAEGQEVASVEFVHFVYDNNGHYLGFMMTSAQENELDKMELKEVKKFSMAEAEKVLETFEYNESVANALQLYLLLQDDKIGEMSGKPIGVGKCEIEFKNAVAGIYTITVIGCSNGEVFRRKIILEDGDTIMLFAFEPTSEWNSWNGQYQVKVVGQEMGYQGFLKLSE